MKWSTTVVLFSLSAIVSAIPSPLSILTTEKDVSANVHKSVHQVVSYSNPPPPTIKKESFIRGAPNVTVSGFAYYGCHSDARQDRVLKEKSIFSPNTTYASCSAFCAGSQFFGVEYYSECYCGSKIANSSVKTKDADCWMPCSGDAKSTCGGTDRISIFKAINYTTPTVVNPAEIPGYAYRGCYEDQVGKRTLGGPYFFDEKMTTSKCAGLCKNSTYFGTEYGGECYCSNLMPLSAKEVDGVGCNVACKGDTSVACGGANKLSTYWKYP
jgi:hypothetical protein